MDVTNEYFSMWGRLEGGPYAVGFRTEWRTDALIHAERFYIAASHLSHNDFLTRSGVGADFRAGLRGEPTPHPTRLAYEEVCRVTRRFFDATLKNDADARNALQSAAQTGEPTGGVKIIAHKPAE